MGASANAYGAALWVLAIVAGAVGVAGAWADIPSLGPVQFVQAGQSPTDIDVGDYSVPSLADFDSDGLPDLIVSDGPDVSNRGRVRVYLNRGTRQVPRFDDFFHVQADGNDLTFVRQGCLVGFPRVVYWDGDGRKDLLIGQADGTIKLYLNVGTDTAPTFDAGRLLTVGEPGAKAPINVRGRTTPAVADWNTDGRKDLVVGSVDGLIRVYLNEGTDDDPDFRTERFVTLGGANLIVPTERSSPVVVDFDGDGLADLVCGNTKGQVLFYRNVGTAAEPRFDGYEFLRSDGAVIDIDTGPTDGVQSRPAVCDWSGDGRPDLLVGSYDGKIRLYEYPAAWTDPTETVLTAAGGRLTVLQNDDGGWDDPLDDGDPTAGTIPGSSGVVGLGLAVTYPFGAGANRLDALERTGVLLLGRVDDFLAREAVLAAALDRIFGTSAYSEHVRQMFYDRLAAGTYYDAYTAMADMTTEQYIASVVDYYGAEGVNTAAWDLGVSLVDAYAAGAATGPWVAAVCEQIDRMDAAWDDDVLGLAGALFGLATVGYDYDPQGGAYAAAQDLAGLADILLGFQMPSGGFTYHAGAMNPGDETVSVTAYAILALAALDRTAYAQAIADARQFLLDVQLPTGGWEDYIGAGEQSWITGEVARALAAAVPSAADFQDDGRVDLGDWAVLSAYWGRADCRLCGRADANRDGRVNLADLGILAERWLTGP